MHNHAIGGYVDIHAHVLPGVDDGPSNLNDALELARAATAAGTDLIASTPHLRWDFPNVHVHELATRCRGLREAIKREQIPIRVVCAGEASLTWALEASEEELKLVSYGQRGTDLLIETPVDPVLGMDWSIDSLQANGYRITLAHPERSAVFQRDEEPLRELVDHGVLLQINASSLLPPSRRRAHGRLARSLCEEGLAHVLASDGHRASEWRAVTDLAEAASVATELVGPERAQWMTQTAPSSIVDGAALPEAPAIVARQRPRRLFGRRRS